VIFFGFYTFCDHPIKLTFPPVFTREVIFFTLQFTEFITLEIIKYPHKADTIMIQLLSTLLLNARFPKLQYEVAEKYTITHLSEGSHTCWRDNLLDHRVNLLEWSRELLCKCFTTWKHKICITRRIRIVFYSNKLISVVFLFQSFFFLLCKFCVSMWWNTCRVILLITRVNLHDDLK